MKRIALLLCLSLGFVSLFAQESVKLQNAGNDALKAKDYAKALESYEKAMAVWVLPHKIRSCYTTAGSVAFR